MKIILPDKSVLETEQGSRVIEDILKELGINPSLVIISKNGTIVPEDVTADDNDEIKIITFSHGG